MDHVQVRLEMLRPGEIEAALAAAPIVYMPLGTIEWHSVHLPVGLDGLTAHGVCVRAALASGGLVYPPLFFGTGGGHGEYPWTVMMPTAEHVRAMLEHALLRMSSFGVRRVVLFSGHFADEQLEMIADIASQWNATGHEMSVRAAGINMAEGLAIAPDHAGVFETTMLYSLAPDRVDVAQLPPLGADVPSGRSADAAPDDFGDARHDPTHELWGVFGPDPRRFDPTVAADLLSATARWLADLASQ